MPRAFPRILAVSACALLLGAPAATAADGENTKLDLADAPRAAAQSGGGPGAGSWVRAIVGLAIVLGVIYGLTWVLRQVKAGREDRAAGSGLETVATLPLGADKSLHLVRAGREIVLLGAAQSGVTAIRTYPEDEARALGLLEEDDGIGGLPSGGAVAVVGATIPARGGLVERLRRRTVIRR